MLLEAIIIALLGYPHDLWSYSPHDIWSYSNALWNYIHPPWG